jgi:DNA-binding MarR family transcriptional regulator
MSSSAPDLLLALDRVSTLLHSLLERMLADAGLTTAQWGTLRFVRDNPGLSGADLARLARVTPASATTMLQRLEGAGLVERTAQESGRVIETLLTPKGRSLLEAGERIVADVEGHLRRELGGKERLMREALAEVAEALLRKAASEGLEPGTLKRLMGPGGEPPGHPKPVGGTGRGKPRP